ncbi:uncharacterized protein HMPREF1120_04165 [Exophiala dermatitidis NIH/UT8656]|uniref:Uncharacterized protein n=1 Tax=Exophiala dermatitidis (strain ATCC 34100 / CBS 525.76 / NIH/UT8656) TaxID=858893 RepID=H6BWE5_EXODN|nr:uncharacterized protein HMPREF1120_04165 [Exophiala dermatitidis NIH/UT8656]EHY56061.1 hypothetical protein HMPREF1120_04165 [Exophiala dermatitidis NIH/UT8656]
MASTTTTHDNARTKRMLMGSLRPGQSIGSPYIYHARLSTIAPSSHFQLFNLCASTTIPSFPTAQPHEAAWPNPQSVWYVSKAWTLERAARTAGVPWTGVPVRVLLWQCSARKKVCKVPKFKAKRRSAN